MPFLIDFLKNPPLSSSFPSLHRLCFQLCLSITLRSLPSLMWVTIHLLWSILNSALMHLSVCVRVCAPVFLCAFCLRVCVHYPPLLLYQPESHNVFIASHKGVCEHLRSFFFKIIIIILSSLHPCECVTMYERCVRYVEQANLYWSWLQGIFQTVG